MLANDSEYVLLGAASAETVVGVGAAVAAGLGDATLGLAAGLADGEAAVAAGALVGFAAGAVVGAAAGALVAAGAAACGEHAASTLLMTGKLQPTAATRRRTSRRERLDPFTETSLRFQSAPPSQLTILARQNASQAAEANRQQQNDSSGNLLIERRHL